MKKSNQLDGPPYLFYPGVWRSIRSLTFIVLLLLGTLLFTRSLLNGDMPFAFDTSDHALQSLLGTVGPLVFAGLLAMYVRALFSPKPVLTIDEDGWTSNSLTSYHVDWADVHSISAVSLRYRPAIGPSSRAGSFVGVVPRDPEAFLSRLPARASNIARHNYSTFGMVAMVSSQFLPMDPNRLIELTGLYTSRKIREAQPVAPPILGSPLEREDWSVKPG